MLTYPIHEFRITLENELKLLLENYDREINERDSCLRQLLRTLKTESEILNDWTEKGLTQEKIYDTIVTEKEYEEAKEREERILLFMMNRAAITIQRAYRRILSKRKSKRKIKKIKK